MHDRNDLEPHKHPARFERYSDTRKYRSYSGTYGYVEQKKTYYWYFLLLLWPILYIFGNK